MNNKNFCIGKFIIKLFFGLVLIIGIQLLNPLKVLASQEYRTYSLYSDPVIPDNCSKTYNTFMIDFKATKAPQLTYWNLCNFGIDLSRLRSNVYRIENYSDSNIAQYMGGYGGLQHTEPDGQKNAIMSIWNQKYFTTQSDYQNYIRTNNSKYYNILKANCIYPDVEDDFDGEGER